MRKTRKTLVAKLLAMALVCATAFCACEEDESINDNGNSTEQGGTSGGGSGATPAPDGSEDTLKVRTITVNGISFKMIKVEGGTFTMGATAEQGEDADIYAKPAHQVTLSSYWIGEAEVTQALWEAVMGGNPSNFTVDNTQPVEQVSWNTCQEFISRLNELTGRNFRLPTEAEWEYAARGGNQSQGYKYAGSNTLDHVAWYYDNSDNTTHPVKQKAANELGLYDMSGNVWEWCSDWFGDYTASAQTNPQGATSGDTKVLRGGSWYHIEENARVSYRLNDFPDNSHYSYGLRLAMDQ